MADSHGHDHTGEHQSGVSPAVINLLEMLDNVAHVVVAIFFIILAGSVLIYASLMLVRDMPLIVQPPHAATTERSADEGTSHTAVKSVRTERPRSGEPVEGAASSTGSEKSGAGTSGDQTAAAEHHAVEPSREAAISHTDAETANTPAGHGGENTANLFLRSSLELLSTLLFVVIVLELLKTIITYLKTHNIQAIMKEFLVVGIISSIRKILLVGAESSIGSADPTSAYVKEATGTVITIVGILLLIAGLIFLQRTENIPVRDKTEL